MQSNPIIKLPYLKQTMLAFIFTLSAFCSFAQKTEMQPAWWLGISGGANFNSYAGYTSALNVDINAVPAFSKGDGVGGYFAALIEYHPQHSVFGLMLQQGADSRRGNFKEAGRKLEAKISYFTIEPAIVFTPRNSSFFIYAGPRLGLLWSTRFTYMEPGGVEYPQKNINPPAYIKNLDKITGSLHAGIGYNFRIFRKGGNRVFVLAPFVTYLPSLNQNLRTIESLTLNTIRAGIILKAGMGRNDD